MTRVGICTWAFADSAAGRRDPAELTRVARQAGFASLEGAYARQGTTSMGQPPPGTLAVPIASLATLETNRFSLSSQHASRREQGLHALEGMIRCASAWCIPSVSISPGAAPAGIEPRSLLSDLIAVLAPQAALAGELGVTLCLENVPGHLLDHRDAMATVLEQLPLVRLCLDIGNTLADPPLHAWCAEFGDLVAKVHLSDGRKTSGRWAPTWIGNGDVDWGEVRAFLKDAQDADVFVEVLWDGTTEDVQFVNRLADATTKLLDGLAS